MKNVNKILLSAMIIPMLLAPIKAFAGETATSYTVQNGDSLWKISAKTGVTIDYLKVVNNLNSLSMNNLLPGQILKLIPDVNNYIVKSGDSLWKIATANKLTVEYLKALNKLNTDIINIGQVIKLKPDTIAVPSPVVVIPSPIITQNTPQPVKDFPSVTYIVQAGNTADSIGRLFNVSAVDIMKYNYMGINDWFNIGQKIAINGYAPRDYAVVPGMDKAATQYGTAVDWFRDGQYLLKRNDVFTIVDFSTRKQFTVKVMGGYTHADIEPLTASDTAVMKSLFNEWNWTPRPVVIFHNGMNIAGSLSGMPHSFDTTPDNGVIGHFDLYLKNSLPHTGTVSQTYVQQHYSNIIISSGQK
jgi:D-gamma-glutamyl-meso-diaminopimelic acid endopeptidase CwlS